MRAVLSSTTWTSPLGPAKSVTGAVMPVRAPLAQTACSAWMDISYKMALVWSSAQWVFIRRETDARDVMKIARCVMDLISVGCVNNLTLC